MGKPRTQPEAGSVPPSAPEAAAAPATALDRADYWWMAALTLFTLVTRAVRLSWPRSQVFDEAHYVPAAIRLLSGDLDPNATSHPTLAKWLIALGMKIVSAFTHAQVTDTSGSLAWRMSALIAGVLMIPLLYLLARRMFRPRLVAVLAALFLSVDFLHFTMGRIAMLDPFMALFALGGSYFAWRWVEEPRAKWLAWTGVCFGLSMACKWSSILALGGIGVAAVLLAPVRVREGESRIWRWAEQSSAAVVVVLGLVMTLYSLAFVNELAPHKIPPLGTVPAPAAPSSSGNVPPALLPPPASSAPAAMTTRRTILEIIKNHLTIYEFHQDPKEKFEHPYLSRYWQWPLVHRPIWFYYEEGPKPNPKAPGAVNGILCLGSPVFWWMFVPFALSALGMWALTRDRALVFCLMAYLPLWLGWALAVKGGFFFYMLPAVPWMAVIVAWGVVEAGAVFRWPWLPWVYAAAAVGMFAWFYPILAAWPVPHWYYDRLMWFKSWI